MNVTADDSLDDIEVTPGMIEAGARAKLHFTNPRARCRPGAVVSAPGRPESLCPRRVWSLWDMLRLKADSFYGVTSGLITLRLRVAELSHAGEQDEPDGGLTIRLVNDPVSVNYLRRQAAELIENLETLGARVTMMSARRLRNEVSSPDGFSWKAVSDQCEEIHHRLRDELSLATVFVLEEQKAALYEPASPLFGDEVQTKFPTEAAFEIDEAAKCIALGRPTAGVFHLMRVMEIGIRSITQCLGIPDPIKPAERNWAIILKAIRSKGIETKWPTAADRMSGDGHFFDDLHAFLEAVKSPWRNEIMHVEGKYTDDEAEHIFVAVRGFMKKLASRCDEGGNPKA